MIKIRDAGWATCERLRDGKVCGKPSRNRNGKGCSTCINRDSQAKDPEFATLSKEVYYERHYKKALERAKDYYWRDPDKQCARVKAWREANKDKVKAYERNRTEARRLARQATGGNLADQQQSILPPTRPSADVVIDSGRKTEVGA